MSIHVYKYIIALSLVLFSRERVIYHDGIYCSRRCTILCRGKRLV